MHKPFSIRLLAALIVLLACVQGAATYWDLYFFVWWLDIPMHLLGGFWISAATITYRLSRNSSGGGDATLVLLAYALVATLLIGLGWELFEWSVDRVNGLIHFDLLDTLGDLANDVIGASVAAGILLRKNNV